MKNNRFSLPVPPGAIAKLPQIVAGFPHVVVAPDGLSAVLYAHESSTVMLVEPAGSDALAFEVLATGAALSTEELQEAISETLNQVLAAQGLL